MPTSRYGKPPYYPGTEKGKTATKANWNRSDPPEDKEDKGKKR